MRRPASLCLAIASLATERRSTRHLPTSHPPRAGCATGFQEAAGQLSGAVSSPVAGPLAAWMPPRSLHGRIHGVSRKR
ncbi:hypothetical protein XarjCFBP8253_09585 [Xanthomonas arboricola pv. juglandis]|nr:hypothetical protein XarjCFBP8253_09585 [Xanthomonas arboricola pv. juglandis]PPU57148.1 hypothetical protein XacyCFBP1159_18940 [Xanthomonas arboricola pv. corylina]